MPRRIPILSTCQFNRCPCHVSSEHDRPPISCFARLSIFAVCFSWPFSLGSAATLEIVVPAYFYPSAESAWDELTRAASRVSITAILNPASGPGLESDPSYVAAINDLRAAGGRVIGYVPTGFGNRAVADALADINAYDAFYDIDGIFIDEMNNRGAQGVLNYYGEIYDHVKSIDATWELMGNPGTNTSEVFLTWPVVDRLVITENLANVYTDFVADQWVSRYDSAAFVHLVHTEPDVGMLKSHLESAVSQNAGAIYITDDVLPNPWNRLPTYWQAELQSIADWVSGADINRDGETDCLDIDRLTQAIVSGQTSVQFDMNADGIVDLLDRDQWFIDSGIGDGVIPHGDSNLDGSVDAADWTIVSANLFTDNPLWCAGDFNTDGAVDGSDVNVWLNHRTDVAVNNVAPKLVPESSSHSLPRLLLLTTLLIRLARPVVNHSNARP